MTILAVVPSQPYVTAKAAPLPGEGRYRVTVTASPEAPLGRSIVPVIVRTDLEMQKTLNLQVTLDKGIVTEPPIVFYGLLPPDLKTPVRATVTLTRRSSPFHIKRLDVDDPQLTPRLQTVREGHEYGVTVTYAGGWLTGLKQAVLTVATDDPVQPTIKVPVQALIQTKATFLPPAVVR